MITATINQADIARALDEDVRAMSKRVRLATEQTGREKMLLPLREMTRRSLNSNKLPTTWRGAVYPKDDAVTLAPAFFVYSKAPKIVLAHEDGATIRPIGGKKHLWIPTEHVPRKQGGARMTPREVQAKVGRFVLLPSKRGGFLALAKATKGRKRSQKRGANKDGRAGATTLKRGGELLPLFILKPQVRLQKRLDVRSVAERAGAAYATAYQRAANDS